LEQCFEKVETMKTKDALDSLVKKLQDSIHREEEKTYSKEVIINYRNPTFFKKLTSPDSKAEITGPCGDTISLEITIKNGIIEDAGFSTDGCGPSIACGNKLCSMIVEKTLEEAGHVSSKHLRKSLGGLPKDHEHCSVLAVNTLKACLDSYKRNHE